MLLKLLLRSNKKVNNKLTNSALICQKILFKVLSFFSFKHHVNTTRLLCKNFKYLIEAKINKFCPERVLKYSFKPGFIYPTRNNKIIMLPNIVHIYLYHYFPDYNQWIFNYVLNREFHLTMDTLNHRRTTFCYTIFKFKKIKYLKLVNLGIVGLYLNGLVANAEKVCFKNVVFSLMNKEMVKSDAKHFTLKACSNLQHLFNTRFVNSSFVNIIRCDVMRELFKIFSGEVVEHMIIR